MTRPGDPTKTDEHERRLARLEKALGEALARSEAADAMLEDQRQRLKALGAGREETMRALTEVRQELKRVSQERDELRKKLERVDSVQTATIALPDDYAGPSADDMPSLEDLMGALGEIEQPGPLVAGHLHQRVAAPDDSEEMISPTLVFPEEFAEVADSSGRTDRSKDNEAGVWRVLVLLDSERPIKYPLYKETMTIGRADIADIQIDNGFLSRLHA
ncbi:MAG TPA: hypothetical protein VM692_05045, partial [Gammaproteobacteria bacterium]|nr:hypothetical protein [Gammaproteobacteria bacterium]